MRRFVIVLCLSAWFFSCGRNAVVTDDYAERQVDSTVFSIHDIDSLSTVMESYASGGNTYGEMVAARELGKKLRNVSRFYDAIDSPGAQ